MLKIFITLLFLLPLTALSENLQEIGKSDLESKTAEKTPKKKWSLTGSASLSKGWKDSSDPFISPALSFSTKWNKFSFGISQGFKYSFYVYKDVSPLTASNTSVSASYSLNKKLPYDIKLPSLSFSFSLPITEHSRINDIYSSLRLSSSLSKSFLNKKLNASVSASFVYFLNKYKTTVTGEDQGGGRPLPQISSSINSNLRYTVKKWLSAFVSFGLGVRKHEKTKYVNERPDYENLQNPLNHSLSFRLGLSAKYKKLSLSLGHSHGQSLEQHGGVYWYLYDPEVSRFYLSASYSY